MRSPPITSVVSSAPFRMRAHTRSATAGCTLLRLPPPPASANTPILTCSGASSDAQYMLPLPHLHGGCLAGRLQLQALLRLLLGP